MQRLSDSFHIPLLSTKYKAVISFSFRLRHGSICAEQWADGYESEPLCKDGKYRN